MKVKIEYEFDPRYSGPFWAFTTVDGRLIIKSGSSFLAAKDALLETLQKMTNKPTIPESEELEV